MCDRWSFNWPSVCDLREESDLQLMYTSMLVMYVKDMDTLKRSYEWERDFKSKISSDRGKNTHLIGSSGVKIEKKLDIPQFDEEAFEKTNFHIYIPPPPEVKKKNVIITNKKSIDDIDKMEISQNTTSTLKLGEKEEEVSKFRPNQLKARLLRDLQSASELNLTILKEQKLALTTPVAVSKPSGIKVIPRNRSGRPGGEATEPVAPSVPSAPTITISITNDHDSEDSDGEELIEGQTNGKKVNLPRSKHKKKKRSPSGKKKPNIISEDSETVNHIVKGKKTTISSTSTISLPIVKGIVGNDAIAKLTTKQR